MCDVSSLLLLLLLLLLFWGGDRHVLTQVVVCLFASGGTSFGHCVCVQVLFRSCVRVAGSPRAHRRVPVCPLPAHRRGPCLRHGLAEVGSLVCTLMCTTQMCTRPEFGSDLALTLSALPSLVRPAICAHALMRFLLCMFVLSQVRCWGCRVPQ